MRIIGDSITIHELKAMTGNYFEDMVKAVVDIEKNIIALDAELHADLESMMIQNGSEQKNLWGINLYPDNPREDFVEFDSMINIRPFMHNRSRSVEDENIRRRILECIDKVVAF